MVSELTSFFRALEPPLLPLSVLVGVSGGADSVALVHLLHEHQEKLGIGRLAAAHVNHGLRGEESDGDEEFVKGISGRLQIEFFRVRLCEPDSGIEEWARRERYKFLLETAKANAFGYVATAHTANDQAETLLLRLMRGTGVRGMRGILPVRKDGVIRPLLGVERRELEEWLSAKGLGYRTDSSNADDKYRRNFVRNRVIPLMLEVNPGTVQNLAAAAANAAQTWEFAEEKINAWIKQYVIRINSEAFHIENAGFTHGIAAAPEALAVLFEDYGIPVSKLHITRVLNTPPQSPGGHLLPGGWRFYPREDRICFVFK